MNKLKEVMFKSVQTINFMKQFGCNIINLKYGNPYNTDSRETVRWKPSNDISFACKVPISATNLFSSSISQNDKSESLFLFYIIRKNNLINPTYLYFMGKKTLKVAFERNHWL